MRVMGFSAVADKTPCWMKSCRSNSLRPTNIICWLSPARIARVFALNLLLHFAVAAFAEHHFACADYTQGKVYIVSTDGKVEWEHPAPSCDELWALPNGNLLFTTRSE